MNFAYGTVTDEVVTFAGVTVPVPATKTAVMPHDVVVGLRPTGFSATPRPGWPTVEVVPELVEELGDERYVIFDLDTPRVDTDATRAAMSAAATESALPDEERARFTARLPADVDAARGRPMTLSLDPEHLYFFDPATGAALE
jgi:multiple sugar transport system ATP-binding protein